MMINKMNDKEDNNTEEEKKDYHIKEDG